MISPAQTDLLDHVGPWTEQDYLALPAERGRIELLDGGLLVSPSPGGRHQRLSSHFWLAVSAALPAGLEVLEAVNVRVAPGEILIPDLAVVTNPGADLTVWEPGEVAMVVEIVSPGSVAADRAIKPQLYARAGIRHHLRIELTTPAPRAVAYRLEHGCYVEAARAEPGQVLHLTEPVALEVDLAELAAATRPGQ